MSEDLEAKGMSDEFIDIDKTDEKKNYIIIVIILYIIVIILTILLIFNLKNQKDTITNNSKNNQIEDVIK